MAGRITTLEGFAKKVEKEIKNFLPEEFKDAEVQIKEVIKNNDTRLTGLMLQREGETITPTLYLEPFFEMYVEDKAFIGNVMTRIADTYVEAIEKSPYSQDAENIIKNILDWENVKEKVLPRLVNRDFNEENLKIGPYALYDTDLAVTYHISLGSDEDGSEASVRITNEMLEKYGISERELFNQAVENMNLINPPVLQSMVEVLTGLMGADPEDLGVEDDGSMYVVSNKSKVFGAAAVLDKDFMKEVFEKIGDCFILPSSVHELIFVPKKTEAKVSDLNAMVTEVNETQVAPNEVLSDHAYEYDLETGMLYRAGSRVVGEAAAV